MQAVGVHFVSLILLITCGLSWGADCPPMWFDCGNGRCIAEIWLCDGENDCGNLNDEKDCENVIVSTPCLSSQYECESDKHCIPERWHCDGDEDCLDGSDEMRCDNVTECTGFTCRNHHCIPDKWRCDGNSDCSDGSDEELCSQDKMCADSEFLCSSGSCLNQSLVCNGKKDCNDGSDEGAHCGDSCKNITCSQKCKSSPAGPQCYCNDGYVLDIKDNKTCIDIDECQEEGFCSHKCTNAAGSYECTCQEGYELVNRTCKAEGADPLLIFTTVKEVRGLRLGSGQYFLVRRAISGASAVDVDPNSQRIYWIEISNRSSIYSAKIDGTGFKTVLSHGLLVPEDLAVDYVADHVYITDSGLRQVLACKTDGTMCHVLHDTNIEKPRSIVLDLTEGLMYWSDWGEHASGIYRSGMDGSRRISLVSSRISWPNGIAIDHSTNRLYWADARLNTIEYISLDGSSRKVILNATVFHPYSLSVFEDNIYWTDWSTFSLESCNKFTGHKMTLVARENGRHIMGVHVYHPVLTAKVTNPCWSSDCSHMCLISPMGGFRCACPNGFKLSTDRKTCTMEENEASIFVSEGSSVFYIRPKSVGSDTLTELPVSLRESMISRVSYDSWLHYLFVADISKPAIYAINMESLHIRELVRNRITSPEDLAFDWMSNNLYWTDSGKGTVEVISVESSKRVTLLSNLMGPSALAISPTEGHMFVASVGGQAAVTMYGMDGKNKRILYSVQGLPMSLALHPSKDILYWSDPRAGTISYVNFSSSSSARIVKSGIDGVMSVAVSEEDIYWTTRKRELNLLKGNMTHILPLPGQDKGMVSRKVTFIPETKRIAASRCRAGNGGCSYLCLTSPRGRTCICSSEMMLSSDNVTCVAKACESRDFKCMNGECLPAELRCDGKNDCIDGSDEVGCSSKCSEDDFQCKNGRCILKSWRCDYRNDCGDNSDEQNCPTAATCNKDQMACMNGECVAMLWRCDGEPDCLDSSDEANCNMTLCNGANQVRCDNGQCVPVSWVCDGSSDCFDGSDEKNCSRKAATCSAHDFRCESDGACLDQVLKCDGRADCNDESDEKNCPESRMDCKKGMFPCKDGICIYDYEVCDGHEDCSHNEDELNCTHAVCLPEELLCPSKRCILRKWICDGDEDCPDGSDEIDCVKSRTHPTTRPKISDDSSCDGFYCYVTGICLPWSKVCDGRQDCEDLPDEGGQCTRSCFGDNGGCSHTCRKTPSGSKCICNKGYRLLPDNKTCIDVDECLEPGTCSHFCNNTRGYFKCSCAEGYFLHHDHRSCRAEGGSATLMYLLGDQIRGFDLNSHAQKVFINLKDADLMGMDYDSSKGVIYWTELNDGSVNIYSPETRRHEVILTSSSRPVVIKYDWIAGNLYYRDETSRIRACSSDGEFCSTLVQSNTLLIDSMDITPTSGLMFWTIWANRLRDQNSGLIERAEMDGSHRLVIVSDKTNSPTAITVDHVLKMIYWTDRKLNTLECADFHGFLRREVVQSSISIPLAVAVFEDHVYWADWGTDSIMRCPKYPGEDCEKIREGNVKARNIVLVHNVTRPKGVNRCLDNKCQHLCLLTRSNYSCVYDDDLRKNATIHDDALGHNGTMHDVVLRRNGSIHDALGHNGTMHAVVLKRNGTIYEDVLGPNGTNSFLSATMSTLECPKDFCHNQAECIVTDGEYICNCSLPYSGKRCEVEAAAANNPSYDYSWVVAVIFALVVTGIIILMMFLCIRNREKIQKMSDSVTVKFRNPKSGHESRLVMDTDDGNCEELVLEQDGEYKQRPGNSEYKLSNSDECDFKKWPSYEFDSRRIGDSIASFFQKLKRSPAAV